MEAIYDRNLLDVQTAKEFRAKILTNGFDSLSNDEKTQWFSGLKGCINYTDLNRIEQNCKTLSDIFELGLTVKTNWTQEDTLNARLQDFTRIRNNVEAIRETNYVRFDTPYTPSLPLNTYTKINDIEKILYDVYTMYNAVTAVQYYMNNEIYINEQIGVYQ